MPASEAYRLRTGKGGLLAFEELRNLFPKIMEMAAFGPDARPGDILYLDVLHCFSSPSDTP